ncbi:MAG: GGDEF domain-containing protein [Treponema sp.]|nr:GGDEF domain-containing protein [Treponema sp.]
MRNLFYSWRYYSFGRELYREYMSSIFSQNLVSLGQTNILVAVISAGFSFFPILVENNIPRAGIYFAVAVIALLLTVYAKYNIRKENKNNLLINVLITLYYLNIILFGIYLSVFTDPEKISAIFLVLLMGALQMLINSPIFNLCLTLGAMAVFIVSTVMVKPPVIWAYDVVDVIATGIISLYANWHVCRLRLGMEISSSRLKEERNEYINQSTTDELTQLKNRRDFEQTFQRYLSNYRSSDDLFCIAIGDIDFFKNYNDFYGHPAGDECLRAVGRVFNNLKDTKGVYSARVGGEEFALLWFGKDVFQVEDVVSYTINAIGKLRIPHEKSKASPYVSLSLGVYVVRCGASNDGKKLYELADQALYTAKEKGRNCAIVRGSQIKQYKIAPVSDPQFEDFLMSGKII